MKRFFIILTLSLLLQSCSSEKLPDERPKDMVVTYSEEGGMVNKGKSIYISLDSSYIITRNHGTENKVYMKFSNTDLNTLYKAFRDNNFQAIETYTVEGIQDRGGSSVSLTFGGKTITKSNTGTSFVDESSEKYYLEIELAINRLVDDFLDKLKRNFKIELDTSLIGDNRSLLFKMNDEYSYNSGEQGRRDSIVLGILDGPHVFFLTLNEEDSAGKMNPKLNKQLPIDIDPLMAGVRFYFDGEDIKWDRMDRQFN